MKNRFESRKTLNLQIGGPSGAGNVNPLQSKIEIQEAPGAKAIDQISKIMANTAPSPSAATIRAAGEFAQQAGA